MKLILKKNGFGLIEVLIGISLAAILLTAFLTLTWQTVKTSTANAKELRATIYLKELIEIAKDLESSNWEEIASSTCTDSINPEKYYPEATTTFLGNDEWILKEGELSENGAYARSLIIENVSRDPFQNTIATSSCVVDLNDDPKTKKITARVFWNDGFNLRESVLEAYLYNYNP